MSFMIIDADNIPRYTYEEYKLWKDDWELIEGYPYWLRPQGFEHSIVKGNALVEVMQSLRETGNTDNCIAIMSIDWVINDSMVIRPDIIIIPNNTKTDYLIIPPLLIIEVVSSTSAVKDKEIKFQIYEQQGVPFYIIADCEKRFVEVFQLINNQYQQVDKNTFFVSQNIEININYENFWDRLNMIMN